jgi:putative glutathione S-transferase
VSTPNGFGSLSCKGCIPDTINNASTIRELYEMAGDTLGKYTVPVLWDKKLNTIVNNESSEIIEMFDTAFNDLAKNNIDL